MKRFLHLLTVTPCCGLLAACGAPTPTQASFLAQIGSGIANVSCTQASADGSAVVTPIIELSTKDQTQATDLANLASSIVIANALCPAFKGLAGVVIRATVAGTAPSGTPIVRVSVPTSATRGEHPTGRVIKSSPWTYEVPVPQS